MTNQNATTPDDKARLSEIIATTDDKTLVQLIVDYWDDSARGDRTPRGLLYLHLGMLCGLAARLLDVLDDL